MSRRLDARTWISLAKGDGRLPFTAVALFVTVAACNEGGGVASPSNTPHGSRCLMDTDCMGGYECSKGKGDILGECVPKTMGGVGAGGSSGGAGAGAGGATKPAGSSGGGTGGGAAGPTASSKPADPPKGGNKTPEPLPPPKPPKDPKPATDSTFSP